MPRPDRTARSNPATIVSRAGCRSSYNLCPIGVSSTRRLVRLNNGAPMRRSSFLIVWLTRAVETCIRSAVRPKCSSSASVRNASSS